jgi:hypothetical protein
MRGQVLRVLVVSIGALSIAACGTTESRARTTSSDAGRDAPASAAGGAASGGSGGASGSGTAGGVNGGGRSGHAGAGDASVLDGSAPDASDAATSKPPADAASADAADGAGVGPYPPGPYGSKVGSIFPNLELRGYVNDTAVGLANLEPWVEPYTLEDLRKSGGRYALVHISAWFCPGCKHAAADLATLGKGLVDAGGRVVEILSQKTGSTPALRPDLDAWIDSYDLTVTSMIDSAATPLGAVKAVGVRETVVILELPSMKVVYMDHGDTTGKTASSIIAAAAEMHALLGK